MKKIVLILIFLSFSLFAQKAVLVDIVSENIIKVEKEGKVKKLHLVGIELFAKANRSTKDISFKKKQELKQQTLAFMNKSLKKGKEISYSIVNTNDKGLQRVWLDKTQLNYKMVREGYALVDLNDPYLPAFFQMRMSRAMKYAKDKKLGFWANSKIGSAFIDKNININAWKNQKEKPFLTKQAILKEQMDTLPYEAKIYLARKYDL